MKKYKAYVYQKVNGINESDAAYFEDPVEAAKWRDERAKARFGAFAKLNFN
jgi:hypothetical protein